MAELMLGQPLFPGESGIDQLVEIIKVLGTPTRDQIRTMNPNYMEHKFPQIKPHPFNKVRKPNPCCRSSSSHFNQVFRKADSSAIDLISKLLEYTPTQRLSAIDAMVHPFFDELRDPSTRLPDSRHPNGAVRDLPALYNFNHHGKSIASLSVGACSLMDLRIVDRTSPQPTTRPFSHPSHFGVARPGLRITRLQAVNEGPDDGEIRLRVPVPLLRNDTIDYAAWPRSSLCSRAQKSSVQQGQHGASHGVGFQVLELTRVHPYLQYLSESVMIPTFTKNGLLCVLFWLSRLCKPSGWLRKCCFLLPYFLR